MPVVSFTKVNSRRKESRQLAKVWGLTRFWWQRCSVKNAWMWDARSERDEVIRRLLVPHSARSVRQPWSRVLGSRSDTNSFPAGGRGLNRRRDRAAGSAHQLPHGTSSGYARLQRHAATHE